MIKQLSNISPFHVLIIRRKSFLNDCQNGGEAMEVDEEARGEEGEEDDYTAVVLMDSVIEDWRFEGMY
jgi:hypothetical protein